MGLSNVLLEVTDPTSCNVATLLISVATKGFYISPRLSPTIFFHRDASSAILHLGNRCDRGLNFTYYTPVLVSRFIPLRKPEYKEGIILLSRIDDLLLLSVRLRPSVFFYLARQEFSISIACTDPIAGSRLVSHHEEYYVRQRY